MTALLVFGLALGTLVAVLAYRVVAFWLPTAIGAPAYVALVGHSARRRTAGATPRDAHARCPRSRAP